jgi:pimeloyl-ACP methyl ester carboxylesterase
MSRSHWSTARAAEAYRASYARSLELWPIPFESRLVDTPFGRTHVVVSGATTGDPIILVHAASLSATQWYVQARDLGARHPLAAVDIMGDIGLSSEAAPVRTRADAGDWLAAVLGRLAIDRAILVGSSFGGFLSANLAVLRASSVMSLVLLAPAATIHPFRPLANLMIRTGSLVPLPWTVKPGLRGMMGGALPDPRIVAQMELGVAGFRYDRSGIYPSELPDGELAGLGCPTLLLLGDQEMIYDPVRAAERARRLLPNARVEVVPGVGHLLGMQRPDLVNPKILDFINSAGDQAAISSSAVANFESIPVVAGGPP